MPPGVAEACRRSPYVDTVVPVEFPPLHRPVEPACVTGVTGETFADAVSELLRALR